MCANFWRTTARSSTGLQTSSWKRRFWIVKKSIPLSVKGAEQSLAPKTAFPFNHRRAWVMGVLNATPDSFYAGSRGLPNEAPDVIDIGGESTRPGAGALPEDRGVARIQPVIEAGRPQTP